MKLFEVHIDALNRAMGGVLVQEGHPVVFETRKLKGIDVCTPPMRLSIYVETLLVGDPVHSVDKSCR